MQTGERQHQQPQSQQHQIRRALCLTKFPVSLTELTGAELKALLRDRDQLQQSTNATVTLHGHLKSLIISGEVSAAKLCYNLVKTRIDQIQDKTLQEACCYQLIDKALCRGMKLRIAQTPRTWTLVASGKDSPGSMTTELIKKAEEENYLVIKAAAAELLRRLSLISKRKHLSVSFSMNLGTSFYSQGLQSDFQLDMLHLDKSGFRTLIASSDVLWSFTNLHTAPQAAHIQTLLLKLGFSRSDKVHTSISISHRETQEGGTYDDVTWVARPSQEVSDYVSTADPPAKNSLWFISGTTRKFPILTLSTHSPHQSLDCYLKFIAFHHTPADKIPDVRQRLLNNFRYMEIPEPSVLSKEDLSHPISKIDKSLAYTSSDYNVIFTEVRTNPSGELKYQVKVESNGIEDVVNKSLAGELGQFHELTTSLRECLAFVESIKHYVQQVQPAKTTKNSPNPQKLAPLPIALASPVISALNAKATPFEPAKKENRKVSVPRLNPHVAPFEPSGLRASRPSMLNDTKLRINLSQQRDSLDKPTVTLKSPTTTNLPMNQFIRAGSGSLLNRLHTASDVGRPAQNSNSGLENAHFVSKLNCAAPEFTPKSSILRIPTTSRLHENRAQLGNTALRVTSVKPPSSMKSTSHEEISAIIEVGSAPLSEKPVTEQVLLDLLTPTSESVMGEQKEDADNGESPSRELLKSIIRLVDPEEDLLLLI